MNYDIIVAATESVGTPPPGGEEIIFGGVHMLKYVIGAGTVLISHCHVYDHPSILASGEVEVWTPAGLQTLVGPTEIKIAAGVKHAVSAITDAVWYCVHAERDEPLVMGSN